MPEAEPMTAVTQHVYVKNSDGNQAVGQTKSIVNDDKEHAVSIHYPITGISEIDRVIEQKVYSKIEEFENKKVGYQALEPGLIMNLISKETSFPLFFIRKRIFLLWHILWNVLIRWCLR